MSMEPPRAKSKCPANGRRFSPLTHRILAVNLLAPALLVVGLFYLGEYRRSLIAAELSAAFTPLTAQDNVIPVDFSPQKLPPYYRIAAQSEETTGKLFRVLQRAQDQKCKEVYLDEIIDMPKNISGGDIRLFTFKGNHVTLHAPEDFEMILSVGGLDEELDPGEEVTLLLNVLQKASFEIKTDPNASKIESLKIG